MFYNDNRGMIHKERILATFVIKQKSAANLLTFIMVLAINRLLLHVKIHV